MKDPKLKDEKVTNQDEQEVVVNHSQVQDGYDQAVDKKDLPPFTDESEVKKKGS